MRRIQADFIAATVDAVRTGVPRTTVLHGPAGIGKTWAIDRVAELVADEALVLRCSGHPGEQDVPFAHLSMLLQPLRPRLESAPDEAGALLAALAWRSAPVVDDLAVAGELLDVLATEAEDRPVVLLVDDLHWADPASRFAITFAVRRRDREQIHSVLVVRDGEDDDLDGRHLAADDERLLPFDNDASHRLLAAHHRLAPAVAARIVATAGGLPLALVEIPQELDPDQRAGRTPLPELLPAGEGLTRIYRRRLAALSPEGRTTLHLAAVEPLDRAEFDGVIEHLGLPHLAVDEASRVGLLHLDHARVGLSHPTARAAVLQEATPLERERAHRAVASVLAAAAPERAASHLLTLPPQVDEAHVALLVRAATSAEQRGAFDAAGRSWLGAALRTGDEPDRAAHRHRAALAWFRAGRPAALGPLLEELIEEAASPADAARLWAMAILAGTSTADPVSWAEDVEALANRAATTDPAAAADLLQAHAAALTTTGHVVAAEQAVLAARAIDPDRADRLGTRLALDSVGVLRGRSGAGSFLRTDWAEELDDHALLDPTLPVSPAATLLAWLGHADRAADILDRQRRALQGSTARTPVALLAAQEAVVAEAHGDWDAADTAFSQATELGWGAAIGAALGPIRLRHALLLAARGRATEVNEVLADRDVVELADRPINAHAIHRVRGLLALGAEEHAEAFAELEQAHRIEVVLGLGPAGPLSSFGDLYESAVHVGTHDRLDEALTAFVAHAEASGQPMARAVAHRCLAWAGSDDPDTSFETALALHPNGPRSFERARTELAWGRSLRRRRQRGAAREPLHRAATAFVALGASPWVSATERELAACGERRAVGRDHDPALALLTPRELDVCRLVAAGATNAEVAARLVVSRRTAEYHLANAMRKLHVASRLDLRRHFPAPSDRP